MGRVCSRHPSGDRGLLRDLREPRPQSPGTLRVRDQRAPRPCGMGGLLLRHGRDPAGLPHPAAHQPAWQATPAHLPPDRASGPPGARAPHARRGGLGPQGRGEGLSTLRGGAHGLCHPLPVGSPARRPVLRPLGGGSGGLGGPGDSTGPDLRHGDPHRPGVRPASGSAGGGPPPRPGSPAHDGPRDGGGLCDAGRDPRRAPGDPEPPAPGTGGVHLRAGCRARGTAPAPQPPTARGAGGGVRDERGGVDDVRRPPRHQGGRGDGIRGPGQRAPHGGLSADPGAGGVEHPDAGGRGCCPNRPGSRRARAAVGPVVAARPNAAREAARRILGLLPGGAR